MQCREAIQIGRNEGLPHHLMPGAVPASAISTTTLHAITLKFLPANPLGSAKAHDALIAIKSEAQSRLCMAEKLFNGQVLVERFQQCFCLPFEHVNGGAVWLQLLIEFIERLSDEMPMTASVVSVVDEHRFNDIEQQQRLSLIDGCCEWPVIDEPKITLEPDNIHEV
jgi:hypothetical protein